MLCMIWRLREACISATTRMSCSPLPVPANAPSRVMMKPSRDAMLRRESGLRRAVGFGPGWMEDGTWFALRPEGKPDVPGDAFLAALRRLSAATDKPLAVCVQGDRLHVFVTNRILGQKVSSRVPPSAAVAEVDFLPELDGILKASDALV